MNNSDQPNFYLPSSSSSPFPITAIRSNNYNPDNYVYPQQHRRKKRTKLVKTSEPHLQLAIVTSSTSNKPKNNVYGKGKADASAPNVTRPCSECGKKFWSWKALFGHMRCHPERQWRGINPPPNYRRPNTSPINQPQEKEDYFFGATSSTTDCMTEEEHEVAASLLMLANGDINVGDCGEEDGCRFECSCCRKVFGSHQALGGHRASHKNVKGCFAITRVGDGCERSPHEDGYSIGGGIGMDVKEKLEGVDNKSRMMVLEHKCDICLKVFSSGQALGGHKRCHWEKADVDGPHSPLPRVGCCGLDLNLPAPVDDELSPSYSSSLSNLDLRLGL